MRASRLRTHSPAWALLLGLALATPAVAQDCPDSLAGAQKLILITTAGMSTRFALMRRFERNRDGAWEPRGNATPSVVGSNGLGWGLTWRKAAGSGEPLKREGDGKTPAGIFRLGSAFGFGASSLPGYIHLRAGETFCVDEPASPHYSRIVPQRTAGPGTSGERMWSIPLYRLGFVIDYPTSGAERGGSCIFLHIWRSKETGTAGCVAMPEAAVAELHRFVGDSPAAIAILPEHALPAYASCLPPLSKG